MRVGVVGASYASGTHLPVYAELAAAGVVELVAVATAHRETADAVAAKFDVPHAHVGFEALCADPDVDLVDIATRPSRHRAMAEAAFAAGKDVLCEAPLASTLDDGLAMAAAAAGRLAVVDMQSRFRPGLAELRRLVSDGYVGRVDNVVAQALYPTFTQQAAVAGSGWCADAANGASSLRVHGLHTVDVLRWTFGELTDVRGAIATREPTWPGPNGPLQASSADSSAFTARTEGGALVSVHTSWVARFGAGWRLAVHGSAGALLAEAGGHTGHFPVRLSGARVGDDGLRELVPAAGTATGPFAALIRALAADDRTDLPTFDDGVAALRVAEAVEGGTMTVTDETIVLRTFADAKDAYRSKDLRQSLYDEGEVVMDGVLVNLHGDEHRNRRRVENRMFRRDVFDQYERDLFPAVTERTVAPHLAAGKVDLVHLGHELMLNLAALTAGIDRPKGTVEETARLGEYNAKFIQGATLAHSTGDKDAQRVVIARALEDWDAEFLAPSVERRRELLDREAAGEDVEVPRDVLATLLRHHDELDLDDGVIRREVAFFLLAGAHTSATAFVRSIDHILGWLERHPEDAAAVREDALFMQRCVHETVRLNPSSPTGRRRALASVTLRSGVHIPQGATVVIDLQALNRDPELFGPDAAEFNPNRTPPTGVAPFGLGFGAGMHVCIGQDLAAGVVARPGTDPNTHLYGLVTGAVQHVFGVGVRRDPADPPQRDAATARPYWGTYPVLLGE